MDTNVLLEIANNPELMEVGRLAIEDELISWRDSRLAEMGRRNGFVVSEADGTRSNIIRFGPETGIKIALKAIAKHLEEKTK